MSIEFFKESDVVRDYIYGISHKKILIKYDINRKELKAILDKNDIHNQINIKDRKFKINKDFFKKVNSSPKAYLLGFLYADGYNSKYEERTMLEILEEDREVVDYLKKNLQTNLPIRIHKNKTTAGNNSCILDILSLDISSDLHNLGCIYQKSFKLKFPNENQVPPKLIHHFIRGYFDGDGYVSTGKTYNRVTIVGTLDFLTSLQLIFKNNLNIESKISLAHTMYKTQENKMYRLDITGAWNIIRFGKYIYAGAYEGMLKRKYYNFLNIKKKFIKYLTKKTVKGLL